MGEAKNPGPGEDLDIEMLAGWGSEVHGGHEGEADSGREGRSRTPPTNPDTRTPQQEGLDYEMNEDLEPNQEIKAKEEGKVRWRPRSPSGKKGEGKEAPVDGE